MADSSLLSTFPIELIREIIRDSDASTLASWTLASRAFLAFAGPLLHEIVTLSRPQDVVPFLIRPDIRHNTGAQHPSSSSLQYSFLSSLQRLDILALPSLGDSAPLFDHLPFVSYAAPVLKISWEGQTEEDMTGRWIPSLLPHLRSQRYEGLPGESNVLSGELLVCYLRGLDDPTFGDLRNYTTMIALSHQQEGFDLDVAAYLNLPTSPHGTSPLLDSLVVQHQALGAWFEENSMLGEVGTISGHRERLFNHIALQRSKLEELQKCTEEIKIEQARHDDAQILMLEHLGLDQEIESKRSGRARSE